MLECECIVFLDNKNNDKLQNFFFFFFFVDQCSCVRTFMHAGPVYSAPWTLGGTKALGTFCQSGFQWAFLNPSTLLTIEFLRHPLCSFMYCHSPSCPEAKQTNSLFKFSSLGFVGFKCFSWFKFMCRTYVFLKVQLYLSFFINLPHGTGSPSNIRPEKLTLNFRMVWYVFFGFLYLCTFLKFLISNCRI